MTAAEFRRIALGFPGACESAHMNHPDFRFAGRIFATLGAPDEDFGMVKVTPDEQRTLVRKAPKVFTPCNGAWGKQGCTYVHLASATDELLRPALAAAWKGVGAKAARPNRSRQSRRPPGGPGPVRSP